MVGRGEKKQDITLVRYVHNKKCISYFYNIDQHTGSKILFYFYKFFKKIITLDFNHINNIYIYIYIYTCTYVCIHADKSNKQEKYIRYNLTCIKYNKDFLFFRPTIGAQKQFVRLLLL